MKTFCFLVFALFLFRNSFSQTDTSSSFFLNIVKAEFEAFQKKDPALWAGYVDDKAVFAGTDNSFKTKEDIINEMKNAPPVFNDASETYDNVTALIFGNTAILSCVSTFSYVSSDGNKNTVKFKFTRVHTKDAEGWKLVYHTSVPI